jgi:hypothetical protein
MSQENKALVRRYFAEIWDEGNLNLIDELFTTNIARHDPTATEGGVRGLEGTLDEAEHDQAALVPDPTVGSETIFASEHPPLFLLPPRGNLPDYP